MRESVASDPGTREDLYSSSSPLIYSLIVMYLYLEVIDVLLKHLQTPLLNPSFSPTGLPTKIGFQRRLMTVHGSLHQLKHLFLSKS